MNNVNLVGRLSRDPEKRLEGREDDAARKLGELARTFDPSEIYANELEDTQLLCQTLEGCRAAMECMRDHAAEIYRVETGQPFSTVKGSRVSTKLSASMIDARERGRGECRRPADRSPQRRTRPFRLRGSKRRRRRSRPSGEVAHADRRGSEVARPEGLFRAQHPIRDRRQADGFSGARRKRHQPASPVRWQPADASDADRT